MKNFCFLCLALLPFFAKTQTDVRAWYAQGQVWVVWKIGQPVPQTYAIYKKTTSFSSTNQATLVGRLFNFEYLPGTYFQQTGDANFTYRIPRPDGTTYQLEKGEGLFVETVTQTGSAFYAVVEWGKTAVVAGQNLTSAAVNFTFNPNTQPVNCHLQRSETLTTGHKTYWFSMWAMGRQDENAGRPDFPVMANAAKNGMPSMFIISQTLNLDTANGKRVPMTHWFHGGDGVAQQTMANRFKHFNIEPKQGISVSHNDDFPVLTITEAGDTVFTSGRSLWFGWTKRHNPFDFNFAATPTDTVINYTQRRIVWINDWLIKHFPIDPKRVALQGYSMGSGGATVLAKSFPEKFSAVCLFNAGFRGAEDPASIRIVGSMSDNLPTNLRGWNNQTVRIEQAFSLNVPCSSLRDFPIVRVWVGKNDDNGRMHWGPEVAAQFRLADSLGWGTQIHWDERAHTYPTLNFHWIEGEAANQQTYRDNLSFQEFFRADQSFPAFFNHRLDGQNNDPGSGKIGINNGDGDNWGTWGGYHNFDFQNLTDTPGRWEATVWLTSDAVFPNDNSPHDALLADVAIRKPQNFKPAAGKKLEWRVRDPADQVLQIGQTTVAADGLVVIPKVFVNRESFRKVRIQVFDPTVAVDEADDFAFQNFAFPNPTSGLLFFKNEIEQARVFDLNGRLVLEKLAFEKLELDASALPSGFYFLEIEVAGGRRFLKFLKN